MSLFEEGRELDLKVKGKLMHEHHKITNKLDYGSDGLVKEAKLHGHHLEK